MDAALIVGLIALAISVFAILDVRKQVRDLVALERARLFARLIDHLVMRFVVWSPTIDKPLAPGEMNEFNIISHFLDPKMSLDEVQNGVYNEALVLGDLYVKRGYATWRPDWDEAKVNSLVKEWKSEKNKAALSRMFGKYSTWLSQPKKML